VFLPLTFIVGFFGMNFGWMVDRIDTPFAFASLGSLCRCCWFLEAGSRCA
jgi:Mg2+ and Co2+ transporter CorA